MTLIDTNIFLDVFKNDPDWFEWSSIRLAELIRNKQAAINPIIFAELSVNFETLAELDYIVPANEVLRLPYPWDAAWRAGKAQQEYRRRGGPRTSPLADFFIGAHAEAEGMSILTRDVARFRTNFPKVKLIVPG